MGTKEQGYRKLVVWKNAYELRRWIYKITSRFPKSEMRRISQMRDSARSVKQNIQEGYQKNSLGLYIQSLETSKASLGELAGDVEDCFDDGLIDEKEFKYVDSLCGRTDYLFARLLESLNKMRIAGTWKKKYIVQGK